MRPYATEPAVAADTAASGCPPSRGRLPQVVVRVLGPVEVVGGVRPFGRAWSMDLMAYLAMHPEGATSDAWAAALWPDRLMAEATRHSTVSATRRALGRDGEGRDHLPRCNGRLRLGPSVTSDWAQFQALAAVEGAPSPGAWRAALDLVRGRPFEGLRAADWAVLEGIDARVQGAIVQLALRLADRLLAGGDGWGAELAVRSALRASPYDERLYCRLFASADVQGNPGGVEAAMDELVTVLAGTSPRRRATEALPADALAWLHPDTLAVYRSLSRRHVARLRPEGRAADGADRVGGAKGRVPVDC